jgi:hypothetical protein
MEKEQLIKEIAEIVEIANSTEERYKDVIFKTLLEHHLHGDTEQKQRPTHSSKGPQLAPAAEPPSQSELKDSTLHVKFKSIMRKYQLTLEELNKVFYLEKDDVLPLFDSFGSTKVAETQISIALVQALVNSIHTGEPEFNGEDVRAECQKRKAYDSANFAATFKSNSSLFDGLTKYEKGKKIRLSESGKQRMVELVKLLGK